MSGKELRMRHATRLPGKFQVLFCCVAAVLAGAAACTSNSASTGGLAAYTTAKASDARLDVQCIGDQVNDPKEAFHYSYKYSDASTWLEKEADITPQAIAITITDSSGTHKFQGVRSDEHSWNSAILDLSNMNIAMVAARLGSLNGTSSISTQGAETVNGYATSKYAIDTGNAKNPDQQMFQTLFGKGSFDKGTIWMAADSCAAKLVLDEGLWQQDGSIMKAHFEIARIKK